jgi:tetratricopeptide (TPR) repeat protein
MRIIKNNGLYKYNGVTHEYIDTLITNNIKTFEKNELFIKDVGDGGSKQDKFERDIKLLLDGINDEPNNVRYYFYLANSYHDCGRFDEAINVYKKRIELGGWIEEVWYSYYRIGLCFKKLDKIDDAIKYWMKCYDYYPERLEGIYEIIKYYRINSNHRLCDMFYKVAKKILDNNNNRQNYLFLHDDIYSSKIYYEYTIFAAYIGINNIDYEVVKVLNNSKDNNEVNNMLSNIKFYKQILQSKQKIIMDNTINYYVNNENIKFNSSSSCLIPTSNGEYKMNIRYVNYNIDDNGNYLNCDRHIITLNKYVELDKNFNIKNHCLLEFTFDNRRYMGIEDIRIFNDIETDELLFIGSGFHNNNQIGIVSGIYNTETLKLEGNEISQNFNNSQCEKNWVYIDFNNSTHIVYDWNPLNIHKINNETKIIEFVAQRQTPFIFSRIRGSTCGFKYNKKYEKNISVNVNENIIINVEETEIWFVNHIVSYESPRHYYHIISVFDSSMNLLRYSSPFKFEGDPIEYCLSIVVEDDRVLINYSTWDRTTRIGIYDKTYIDSIIKYN